MAVDSQQASRGVPVAVGLLECAADRAERGRDLGDERFAGGGQRDAARRTVEQAHAEPLLESGNRMAERGGRDFDLPGGGAKATAAGDRKNRFKVGERVSFHCSDIFINAYRFVYLVWTAETAYLGPMETTKERAMSVQLPHPIDVYVRQENFGDGDLAESFAADAVVVDEGQTYVGRAAIAQWRATAKRK